MFRSLPRQDPFFRSFEELANLVQRSAGLLQDLLDNFNDVDVQAEAIRAVEEEADAISHQITARLYDSFITPIDREDIFAITRGLDGAIDMIDAAASRLAMYNVEAPTPESKRFAALIADAAAALVDCIGLLHRKDFAELKEPMQRINRAENEADRLLRQVMAALFRSGDDPLAVMKWKEIYESLEEATDRVETLAHRLQSVVVKNA